MSFIFFWGGNCHSGLYACRNAGVVSKRQYTYVCANTVDPAWIRQRFLLSVPPRSSRDTRGVKVRVAVMSRTVFGLSRLIGKADIQLNCLKSELPVFGWFPLRPPSSSSLPSTHRGGIFGSIRLRLQWIYSPVGIIKYTLGCLYRCVFIHNLNSCIIFMVS